MSQERNGRRMRGEGMSRIEGGREGVDEVKMEKKGKIKGKQMEQ